MDFIDPKRIPNFNGSQIFMDLKMDFMDSKSIDEFLCTMDYGDLLVRTPPFTENVTYFLTTEQIIEYTDCLIRRTCAKFIKRPITQ